MLASEWSLYQILITHLRYFWKFCSGFSIVLSCFYSCEKKKKGGFSKELCALALSSLSVLGQHRLTCTAITNPLTRCHWEQPNSISSWSWHYSAFVWVHLLFLSRAEISCLCTLQLVQKCPNQLSFWTTTIVT